MNWKYETWRKVYIREDGTFAALSFSARTLARSLLTVCDDKGRIFARQNEDIVSAICFRLRADRGERRWIREAFKELVYEGHLVRVGDASVRIKNFVAAQGRPDLASHVDANAHLMGDEPAVSEQRMSSDTASNGSPTSNEAAANEQVTGNEEWLKCAETLNTDPDVPSVPDLPFLPGEKTLSSARDPGDGATDTDATRLSPVGPPGAPLADPPPVPPPLRLTFEAYDLEGLMRAIQVNVKPGLGMWVPGQWTAKSFDQFFRSIPQDKRLEMVPEIKRRAERFFRAKDETVFTVARFLDRWNALAGPSEKPKSLKQAGGYPIL